MYTVVEFLKRLDQEVPDRQSYTDGNSIRGFIRRGTIKANFVRRPATRLGRYEIPESEATRIIEALAQKEN